MHCSSDDNNYRHGNSFLDVSPLEAKRERKYFNWAKQKLNIRVGRLARRCGTRLYSPAKLQRRTQHTPESNCCTLADDADAVVGVE